MTPLNSRLPLPDVSHSVTSSVGSLRKAVEEELGLPASVMQMHSSAPVPADAEGEAKDLVLLDSDETLRETLASAAAAGVAPRLVLSPRPDIEWPPIPDYLRDMPNPTSTPVPPNDEKQHTRIH